MPKLISQFWLIKCTKQPGSSIATTSVPKPSPASGYGWRDIRIPVVGSASPCPRTVIHRAAELYTVLRHDKMEKLGQAELDPQVDAVAPAVR